MFRGAFSKQQSSVAQKMLATTSAVLIGVLGLTMIPGHAATGPGAATASQINGVVWLDLDGDGANGSAEVGFTGAQVKLYDSTNALVDTKVTTSTGQYSFTGLPGAFTGPFKVEVTRSAAAWPDPSNWVVSASPAPSGTVYSGADQDVSAQSDARFGIATGVNPGTTIDAGIRPRPELAIGLFGPGIIDGSSPFNTSTTCATATSTAPAGDDCGAANNQVRTADTVTTVWSVTANNFEPGSGAWGPVMFEQILDLTGGAKVDFARIPVSCLPPPSGTGGSTPASAITYTPNSTSPTQIKLTCNLGTFTEGFQESLATTLKVSAQSLHGSTFTTSQGVYQADSRAIPQAAMPVGPIVVSASPAYEVEEKGLFYGDVIYKDIGQGLEPGFRWYEVIQIKTNRATGTEALTQPIVLKQNIYGYHANGTTPYPEMEYTLFECIENPSAWGNVVYGDGDESADPVRASRSVRDSGTCAFARDNPADPTSSYSLTLSGIDMSGKTYPTQLINGSDLSAGPYYVASYRLQFFVPQRIVDGEDGNASNSSGSVALYTRSEDFDPNGLSGGSNMGAAREPGYCDSSLDPYTQLCDAPLPSDNQLGPHMMQVTRAGSMAKYFFQMPTYNSGTYAVLPNAASNHDGAGLGQPGQIFETYFDFSNSGSIPLANSRLCDVFDNSVLKMVPATSGVTGAPAGIYAWLMPSGTYQGANVNAYRSMWIYEYAHIDLTGDDPIDTNDADADPNFDGGTGRYLGNWAQQKAARCDDAAAASGWHTDPTAVTGGVDAVNAVRLRPGTDPGTGADALHMPSVVNRTVFSFEVRNTFFGGPHDGASIPTGTVGANYGSVRADGLWSNTWRSPTYTPAPESGATDGDRITVARSTSSLQKRTITVDGIGGGAAAIGNTGSTLAGSQIVWEVVSSISSLVSGPVQSVKIVDVLPPYVTYNSACTASITGGTPPDLIEPNTNLAGGTATGYTRLTWTLGTWQSNTAIANRRICTDSDPLAPTGTSVSNYAEIYSPEIPTVASDTHVVILDQAGSAQISKTVDRRLDPTNDDQKYTVEFANFAAAFTIDKPTMIDVFPWNGDGLASLSARDPESAYNGTLQLAAAPTITWKNGSTPGGGDPFPAIGTMMYTKDAAATVNYNPDINASKWCTYSGSFSPVAPAIAGDCPSAFSDVTAIKFISNYDLATDGNPRQGIKINYTLNANGNQPSDRYTNRATLDSTSLPAAQFLRSNNVVVEVAGFNLGDLIFGDLNNDGNYDAGIDIPAPVGVPVKVYSDDDLSGGPSVGDTLVKTVLTNANGRWLATGLGMGTYYATVDASIFGTGGLLENWQVQPLGFEIDPNTDSNESVDHHAESIGATSEVSGVRTAGTVVLSATVPVSPLLQPSGDEPLGDNSGNLLPTVTDPFTNFTLDMALKGTGSIGDLVWFDANGDGLKDAGEVGISGAGVTVTWLGFDGVAGGGDDRVFTSTTNASGNYLLANLPIGNYTVAIAGLDSDLAPSHDLDGIASVNTSAVTLTTVAPDRTDVDFGYRLNFTLGDRVFHDVDGDGKWNSSIDTAVPTGVVVELRAADGSLVTSTTTDSSGLYSFTGLLPADYYVQIPSSEFGVGAKLEGWLASFAGTSDPDNDINDSLDHNAFSGVGGPVAAGVRTSAITLSATQGAGFQFTGDEPSGYANNTLDLGLYVPSKISGHVYLDPNSDASHAGSGDTPLAGVQVALTGTTSQGNPITLFATTNAAGYYEFANLPPSNGAGYSISESQPLGYTDHTDYAGSLGGTAGSDIVSAVVVLSNVNGTNYDFTELAPGAPAPRSASLSGSVKVTGTSTPIAGVLVSLTGTDENGNAIAVSATTNSSGVYTFLNLPPSNATGYTVTETQPAGYSDATDTLGSNGGTLGNDVFTGVVLANGDAAVNYNFTEAVPSTPVQTVATLAGSVKINGTNTPIAGVIVTLTGTDANGNTISLSATTGSDGKYTIANIPPSNASGYTVTETQPAGYNDSTDTAGSKGGTAGNDTITGVVLAGGDSATGYNFTETVQVTPVQATASLSGSVKVNGTLTPIAGVIVTLTGTDVHGNEISMSTTTGSNGLYNFSNIAPSNATGYTLTETQPAGYLDAIDSLGSKGGTLGNDTVTGIVLVGGDVANSYDFTETVSPTPVQTTAALSGHVKVNGTSTGIAGVIIALSGTDSHGNAISLSATTDSTGAYTFTNVPPSDASGYTITETQPAGYTDSSDSAGSLGGTVGNDAISGVILAGGSAAVNYDFTEIAPVTPPVPSATVSGSVLVSGTNAPIAGALITLTGVDANGNAITMYATTNASGMYTFQNVPPSSPSGYTLTETQPSGYGDDADVAGTNGGTVGNDVVSAIVVASGDAATGYNFTELAPVNPGTTGTASISGSVKVNGTMTGIAGVLVTLTGNDAAGNPITLYTTTSALGVYSFANVPASGVAGYTLSETQPAGYTDSTDVAGTKGGTIGNDVVTGIVLIDGDSATGYDFTEGLPPTANGVGVASLSGTVLIEGTATGIAGVVVTITGTDSAGNAVNLSTVTAADGSYSFPELPVSDANGYTVTETQPAGYQEGTETAGSKGGTATSNVIAGVILVDGDTAGGYNFTETLAPISVSTGSATISGSVLIDGSTTGIVGVLVTLNGVDAAGNTIVLTTLTGVDGTYSFTNVPASNGAGYTLTETQPGGYNDSTDTLGTAGGLLSNDSVSGIIVTDGLTATGYAFTETIPVVVTPQGTGTISGTVLVAGTATPISGVVIRLSGLDSAGNEIILTTSTGADGSYTFTNVPASDANGYTITETQPAGFVDSDDTAGTAGGAVTNDVISGVVLTNGTTATGYNFTETVPVEVTNAGTGSIAGTVMIANTTTGISGVVIYLTGTDSAGNAISLSTTTEADGSYIFRDVPASNANGYTVTEAQPSGFADSTDTAGTAGGAVTNDLISGIVLTSGTVAVGYNFTETVPPVITPPGSASLTGRVMIAGTTSGIANVTIVVTGVDINGNEVSLMTVTNSTGTYLFPELPPSNTFGYTVTEHQPFGFDDSADFVGSVGGTPGQDATSGVVLVAGATATGYNFTETVTPAPTTTTTTTTSTTPAPTTTPIPTTTASTTIVPTGPVISVPAPTPVVAPVTTAVPTTPTTATTTPKTVTTTISPAGSIGAVTTTTTVGTPVVPYPTTTLAPSTTTPVTTPADGGGSVSGSVYRDRNGNATRDAGEKGVANVVVRISAAVGTSITAITDSSGVYTLPGLPPGKYSVEVSGSAVPTSGKRVVIVDIDGDTINADFGFTDSGVRGLQTVRNIDGATELAFTGSGMAKTMGVIALVLIGLGIALISMRRKRVVEID